MRLSGQRLTLVLTTLFIVVLATGVTAAWSFGRHRVEPLASVAAYQSGPTADQSVRLSTEANAYHQLRALTRPDSPALAKLFRQLFHCFRVS